MKKVTKLDVINRLVKGGHNYDKAKLMTEKHFEYAVRVYPDATIKELSNVIRTIY